MPREMPSLSPLRLSVPEGADTRRRVTYSVAALVATYSVRSVPVRNASRQPTLDVARATPPT